MLKMEFVSIVKRGSIKDQKAKDLEKIIRTVLRIRSNISKIAIFKRNLMKRVLILHLKVVI